MDAMRCPSLSRKDPSLSRKAAATQDLRGFCVLRQHYSPDQVAQFHTGIDELQSIPIDFEAYRSIGVASHALAAAMEDPDHAFWKHGLNSHDVDGVALPDAQSTAIEPVRRVDMGICGTGLWDPIVTDPTLNAIHAELAGGPCNISATYFIEKQGPATGGGLHNGGFPKDKNIYYDYDHRSSTFACSSTKSVVILSDMSQLAGGPFAAIPGSHKSNFRCPFDMSDATKNPMAVPVYASPGDVILFSEGITHNAYPVLDPAILRRSIFFCYMPSISSDK